jgi:hypothetical protein
MNADFQDEKMKILFVLICEICVHLRPNK